MNDTFKTLSTGLPKVSTQRSELGCMSLGGGAAGGNPMPSLAVFQTTRRRRPLTAKVGMQAIWCRCQE